MVYFTTAYKSVGYYHYDEHFQIIEFALLKKGIQHKETLAWEFHQKMRSAIQPALAYLVFEVCDFLSLKNPYQQAFILRLLTALFSLFVIFNFIKTSLPLIRTNYQKAFILLSYFLWFLPWINVRFSSETWSGVAFLLALSFILKQGKRSYLFSGALLGLSFLFRFQSVFLSLGLLLWLIFIRKESLPKLFQLVLSGLIILLLGILIDSWFYGEPVIAFLNYAKITLISKPVNFGSSPWYFYFYTIFRYSFFPFSILITLSFIVLIIKDLKNIFIWPILLFFLVHTIIPHKEMRFLFPLINLIPIVFILSIQKITKPKFHFPKWSYLIIIPLVLINTLALMIMTLKPAGNGRIKIAQVIHEKYQNKPVDLQFYWDANPYSPFGLPNKFYEEDNISMTKLDSAKELNSERNDNQTVNILVLRKDHAGRSDFMKALSSNNFHKVAQSIPQWMEPFLKLYGGYNMGEILILFEKES